jgi:CubicO group peptidase (beta-lactamase class C family)
MQPKSLVKLVIAMQIVAFASLQARADWVDEYVAEQIKKRQIPGLCVAVIRDGRVIKSKGYGLANLELQALANENTVFEIGSISKQFAAEAVMSLVEDGKLNLDEPVNKLLPKNAPDAWRTITVRNLLSHTSGLKDWTEIKEFSYRREYSAEEFIDLIKPYPLNFQPNEDWAYSNSNFPLLGFIVLKPLGLASIRFRHQEQIVLNRASGYVLKDNAWQNGEPFRPRIIAPNGGVMASCIDLARWFEAVLQGRLLKKPTVEQMLTATRLGTGRRINHGFALFKDSFNRHAMIFHHGSTIGGFGSVVRNFPNDRLTLAIMGNLEDGGWGPELISRRVANYYIPGVFVGGLKEIPNAKRSDTSEFLQLLRDLSAGKGTEKLTSSYSSRINQSFRSEIATNLKTLKSFSYLGKEPFDAEHFVLDPTLVELVFYKLVSEHRTVYYTFRLDKEGKVGGILVDE